MSGKQDLKRRIESDPLTYLARYFPKGKLNGDEYEMGDVTGARGKSCRFNIKTQFWADFAKDDISGVGFLSLYAASLGSDTHKALHELSVNENYLDKTPVSKRERGRPPGMGPQAWPYHDGNGRLIMWVERVETETGKIFRPYSFNDKEWRWEKKAVKAPRPLYNLPGILAKQNIIVVEGEKAAEACRKMAGPDFGVTTWPNGAAAVNSAQWEVIRGKNVFLWPDNDDPGHAAMEKISAILSPKNTVKIIRVDDLPEKSDAADIKIENFTEWLAERVPKTVTAEIVEDALEENGINPDDFLDSLASGKYPTALMAEKTGLILSATKKIICNEKNILILLDKIYRDKFWFDTFDQKIMTNYSGQVREVDEDLEVLFMSDLQALGMHRLGTGTVQKAIGMHTRLNNRQNAMEDWLNSLKWDGRHRIDKFFIDYMGAKNTDYATAISKNFFISMVARIIRPGTKFDNMIVLEGKQGIGKGRILKAIASEQRYMSSTVHYSKDLVFSMKGRFIVEFPELAGLDKKSLKTFKGKLSDSTDTERAAYGRKSEDVKRTAVWVGTTNEKSYLHDSTGNRRFWPLEVFKADVEAVIRDREQFFAEAYQRYLKGESFWETPPDAPEEQNLRRSRDPWESIVGDYLAKQRAMGKKVTEIHIVGIDALGLEKRDLDERKADRITALLTLNGYETKVVESGKVVFRFNEGKFYEKN